LCGRFASFVARIELRNFFGRQLGMTAIAQIVGVPALAAAAAGDLPNAHGGLQKNKGGSAMR
jgi:hypothetical protein